MSLFSPSDIFTNEYKDNVVKKPIDDLFCTLVDCYLNKPNWDKFGLFTVSDAISVVRDAQNDRVPSDKAVVLAHKIMTHYKNSLAKMIIAQNKDSKPVTDWHLSVYKLLNATKLSDVIEQSNEPQDVNSNEIYASATDPITRELALLATLPLFYEEEMQLKTLVEQYPDHLIVHDQSTTSLFSTVRFSSLTKKPLTFVTELQHRSKAKRYSNFVFTDTESLFFINIKYTEENYYSLFKSCIRDNKIVVTGHLSASVLDQKLKAYAVTGWEINHDEY
jgi:hypothetical protein